MWPYMLCFLLSCYSARLASRYYKKKNIYRVFSIIAVIFPCILAACRDSTIGTDVGIYGDIIFNNSLKMKFSEFIVYRKADYLYLLVVYLCSHTIGTLQFQYFVLQALTIVPFYSSLQRRESRRYAWVGMAVYYLVLFPYSLNLMRQSIAIALLFWGFKFIEQRNLFKYVFAVLVSTLFHTTAIVGVVVYPIVILMNADTRDITTWNLYPKYKNSFWIKIAYRYGKFISWIIILTTIFLLTQFSRVITILYTFNSENYSHFYNQLLPSKTPIIVEYVVLMFPIFAIYLLQKKYYDCVNGEIRSLFTLSAMGMILYQAAKISAETYRVSLYFNIFLPLFVVELLMYTRKAEKRLFRIILILICLIAFWYKFFVIELWCQIFPYTSKILGI